MRQKKYNDTARADCGLRRYAPSTKQIGAANPIQHSRPTTSSCYFALDGLFAAVEASTGFQIPDGRAPNRMCVDPASQRQALSRTTGERTAVGIRCAPLLTIGRVEITRHHRVYNKYIWCSMSPVEGDTSTRTPPQLHQVYDCPCKCSNYRTLPE